MNDLVIAVLIVLGAAALVLIVHWPQVRLNMELARSLRLLRAHDKAAQVRGEIACGCRECQRVHTLFNSLNKKKTR